MESKTKDTKDKNKNEEKSKNKNRKQSSTMRSRDEETARIYRNEASPRSQDMGDTRGGRMGSPRSQDRGGQRGDRSPSHRRSANKIYNTPPTPPPDQLRSLERQFVLDCIAVNTTSMDYRRVRPKLGQIVRPYNAQVDPATRVYFCSKGVERTLEKTGLTYPGEPIEGSTMDKLYESGAGYRYLSARNQNGAGHSSWTIDGHSQFMAGIKPLDGNNGRYGYRRNNPWLRREPSTFGLITNTPIH